MCNKTPKYDPSCGRMLGSVALHGKWIMIMVIKCAYVNVIFKFCVIISACIVRQFISRIMHMWSACSFVIEVLHAKSKEFPERKFVKTNENIIWRAALTNYHDFTKSHIILIIDQRTTVWIATTRHFKRCHGDQLKRPISHCIGFRRKLHL